LLQLAILISLFLCYIRKRERERERERGRERGRGRERERERKQYLEMLTSDIMHVVTFCIRSTVFPKCFDGTTEGFQVLPVIN
jgi:hypothetical protein